MDITFEMSSEEVEMLRECAVINRVPMDLIVREAILNKVEDHINKLEDRLIQARKQLEKDMLYGSIDITGI